VGRFADLQLPRPLLDRMIRSYCKVYDVELADTVVPAGGFRTFDQFFTRRLVEGARPVDPDESVLTSPCDGHVQSAGRVEKGLVLQAKGRDYRLADLVGDEDACRALEGGTYVTIYLSPRDYHRVHFPCDGEVESCRYMPGRLYTVAPRATRTIDRLFAQNERIATIVRGRSRRVAVVMVGAVGVGRITVSYGGLVTNVGCRAAATRFDPAFACRKGDDLGVFHMGSTVVMAVEGPAGDVLAAEGDAVRMGQALVRLPAQRRESSATSRRASRPPS
jgi:phosphatidylserine decarboxylase